MARTKSTSRARTGGRRGITTRRSPSRRVTRVKPRITKPRRRRR